MLVFPRELSRWALRRPPRDPLTYTQIYDALAHLGLRYHVFYRPDQKIASSGSLRAAPGGPRRLLEAPRAAPPARVAVRSRKHGTWHVPEAQSDVFSAVFAIPEGESGPNPRGNNEKAALPHGVAT